VSECPQTQATGSNSENCKLLSLSTTLTKITAELCRDYFVLAPSDESRTSGMDGLRNLEATVTASGMQQVGTKFLPMGLSAHI